MMVCWRTTVSLCNFEFCFVPKAKCIPSPPLLVPGTSSSSYSGLFSLLFSRDFLYSLNWQTYFYLFTASFFNTKYAPVFSLYSSWWAGLHTGAKADPLPQQDSPKPRSKTAACQPSVSFYGWTSYFLLHSMGPHCEHHDFPLLSEFKYAWRLRAM